MLLTHLGESGRGNDAVLLFHTASASTHHHLCDRQVVTKVQNQGMGHSDTKEGGEDSRFWLKCAGCVWHCERH